MGMFNPHLLEVCYHALTSVRNATHAAEALTVSQC